MDIPQFLYIFIFDCFYWGDYEQTCYKYSYVCFSVDKVFKATEIITSNGKTVCFCKKQPNILCFAFPLPMNESFCCFVSFPAFEVGNFLALLMGVYLIVVLIANFLMLTYD